MKPDFEFLKKVFNKFTQKHNNDDMAARIIRPIASGVKKTSDNMKKEFSREFITSFVQDFYDTLTSQDISDQVSSQIRSLDESTLEDIVSNFTKTLKDPKVANNIAKQIKKALDENGTDKLMDGLDQMMDMANLDMAQKFMAQAFLRQVKPVIEDMQNMSEAEIADQIIDLADQIPSTLIADQVADLTRKFTPERVSKMAHDFVGKFPAPKTITNIFHGVVDSTSQHMDQLSKITDSKDASAIIKSLGQSHKKIVDNAANDDQKSKNSFDKKGGQDFKF